MAKQQRMTLGAIMARKPDVDLAKIDATTEEGISRHMREEGYDPDEAIRDEDIISPTVIRNWLGMIETAQGCASLCSWNGSGERR